jgi:hypothetical protein
MPKRNNRGGVMHAAVAMEQLSKQVSTEMNACNNRGAVFSVLQSVLRGYKKDKGHLSQLSSRVPSEQLVFQNVVKPPRYAGVSCLLSVVEAAQK